MCLALDSKKLKEEIPQEEGLCVQGCPIPTPGAPSFWALHQLLSEHKPGVSRLPYKFHVDFSERPALTWKHAGQEILGLVVQLYYVVTLQNTHRREVCQGVSFAICVSAWEVRKQAAITAYSACTDTEERTGGKCFPNLPKHTIPTPCLTPAKWISRGKCLGICII